MTAVESRILATPDSHQHPAIVTARSLPCDRLLPESANHADDE
jgi:hypothetical protein